MDCRNSGRKCISDLIIFNLYFSSSLSFSKENKYHDVARCNINIMYLKVTTASILKFGAEIKLN